MYNLQPMSDTPEIRFTREELTDELLAMQDEVTAGKVDPELISLVAFAIGQFDTVVEAEVSEGKIDEVQALEFEDFRKGIADAVHEAAKTKMGNIPTVNILNHHRDTPRADAKKAAEEIAKEADRKANADRIVEEIKTVEAKHAVTGQMLRRNRYIDPTTKPHEKNGTWLSHKLEEVVDNGSEIAVFTSQEARIIAGNALTKKSHSDILHLKKDLEQLAKLHELARFLGAHVESGLFSGISKLRELAETSIFDKRSDLKEVQRFIELLEAPADDLFEQVKSAIDEGPFAHCAELEALPFPPDSEQTGKRSLKEIPSDDANEDNIYDDIENAVKASGSSEYIIEEERITEFVKLKQHFEAKYPNNVKIFRSLKSNWHPLPWYIIEIAQPGNEPLAVLESPLYGNATYYINNGDWQGTINFKRKDAQQLGAKPIIHTVGEGKTLEVHTDRIKAVVKAGYKG